MLNTTRLVNNLLDMARIQSGGFNLKKEWLTLEEVVGSALQMLEPGLSSPINLSLPEPLTLIHVDGPLFERVLINLLENAVKYAGAQAEIGIDAHVEGENLQLDVWDNGPGLPPCQSRRYLISLLAGIKSRQYRGRAWTGNLSGDSGCTRGHYYRVQPTGRWCLFSCYTSPANCP